jgi:hypothetical protein
MTVDDDPGRLYGEGARALQYALDDHDAVPAPG